MFQPVGLMFFIAVGRRPCRPEAGLSCVAGEKNRLTKEIKVEHSHRGVRTFVFKRRTYLINPVSFLGDLLA